MYENNCAICGKPIIGYWYTVWKNNICQSCAATTTVYDLFQHDIIDIKPDIIDSDSALVTKAVVEELDSKHALNAVYGKVVNAVYDELHSDAPDIADSEATLVTKDDEEAKAYVASKSQLNSEYGMAVKGTENDSDRYPFNDDGYHYTDEDVAEALKIINNIKAHGCNTEREFFDECQKLWDAGVSDEDNSLLILRKQYEDIMPTPAYEGDTGNETWDVMYHLWQ